MHFQKDNMDAIQILDKKFVEFIPNSKIIEAISAIASRMNQKYRDLNPVFLCVLNGSFMFAADLMKEINFPCEVSFVKLASYVGTSSSGKVKELIGFGEELKGRNVILVEDIVDSGSTLEAIIGSLNKIGVAGYEIATLLYKPEAYKKDISIDYYGLKIPNDFIVGYGLDYNGYGRNLKDIFVFRG